MPLIPETAVAMLACTRIGAIPGLFGGFSPDSLRDRINDAAAKVLITADIGFRRGQPVPLKHNADLAVAACPSIEHVVVVQRQSTGPDRSAPFKAPRDIWWHDIVDRASDVCEPEHMDAEDVLYILYTSGTTGQTERRRAHHRRLSHRGGSHHPRCLRPS